MNGWRLPVTVEVGGQPFSIRSDFRAVLDALSAMQADDLPPEEQRLGLPANFVPSLAGIAEPGGSLHRSDEIY